MTTDRPLLLLRLLRSGWLTARLGGSSRSLTAGGRFLATRLRCKKASNGGLVELAVLLRRECTYTCKIQVQQVV
jgi:hypothetical protein